MCTVVVSLAPEDRVPLLLLGIRDEFTGRPWQPPARHWPGSPLIGGLDEQAGGTWLAVHPDLPRVSCILNGRGEFVRPDRRRSRGELPLRAAAEGRQALRELHADRGMLASYDPFYLVCADLDPFPSVLLLGWDGSTPELTELEPATHVLTNAGHMYPPTSDNRHKPADEKARHFGPKFARQKAVRRPGRYPLRRLGGLAHPGRGRRSSRDRPRRDHRPPRATRRPGVRQHFGQPGGPGPGRQPALRLPAQPQDPAGSDHLVLRGHQVTKAQKNSKYSRISQSLTSWPSGRGSSASASEYRPISKRFIMTR